MKPAKPLRTEVRRRALATAAERLRDAQVVVLSGPRAVGKSTVLRTLAAELGREVVDLDNPSTAQAFTADPMRFLDRPRPVLIDEYAKAPESLDLVKALLNRDGSPGQFLLAGSTRYGSVPAIAQALTGRAQIVPVLPLSQGEITETTESFVEELVRGRTPALADSGLDRAAYADRVLRGGMPMALRIAGEGARQRWFDQYLQLTLDKDVAELRKVRRRVLMPRLATLVAARTAQLANTAKLGQELDLDRSTTEDYLQLLEAVFLHQQLAAWGTTLSARSAATPKLHFVDTGLAARLLRVTREQLLAARPQALQQFGHLLETFVVNEIVKQTHWLDEPVAVGHWRTHDGDEVDLVLERPDGSVIAFEVKASPNVREEDARGLQALARRVGEDRCTGVILHTGKHAFRLGGALALPVASLWQAD
ncbi:MAG: ATP-binding protein [Planctomycetota bacterium]|jgi:predicted AAA+ superfamily ATPase